MTNNEVENFLCREDFGTERNVAVRTVSYGGRSIRSEIAIPKNVSRDQDAAAIYDQSWLRANEKPLVENALGTVRAIDLFCGCGGLTLGIQEACRALGYEFSSVFASDIKLKEAA